RTRIPGQGHRRGRAGGLPAAAAAHPDDFGGLHCRHDPAGALTWRRRRGEVGDRRHRVRRHDRGHPIRPVPDAGVLCRPAYAVRAQAVRHGPSVAHFTANVAFGSDSVIAAMSAARPLFPRRPSAILLGRIRATSRHHFAFSIFVTVNWPLMRSGTKRMRSPGLTALSIAGSPARKTIVMPSSISNFLSGPCLIVILPADSSIFVT